MSAPSAPGPLNARRSALPVTHINHITHITPGTPGTPGATGTPAS
ncbi:MAG: hypothetical protein JWR42_2561, partial [Marmoricola sp.]|nr:hypothetical protein [Marmoricola sp.]